MHNLTSIQSPRIIRIGGGVASKTGEVLQQLGLTKPLIVTDTNLIKIGHVKTLTDILKADNITPYIFDGVLEDPTDTCVTDGLKALNAGNFDCIIGFGGGSPMDTAKAISFMAVNEGHVLGWQT